MLNYKKVSEGPYVYSEIAADHVANLSVTTRIGDGWYLHCLADFVNSGLISENEFVNFVDADFDGDFSTS
jgi:hypothetical protein